MDSSLRVFFNSGHIFITYLLQKNYKKERPNIINLPFVNIKNYGGLFQSYVT